MFSAEGTTTVKVQTQERRLIIWKLESSLVWLEHCWDRMDTRNKGKSVNRGQIWRGLLVPCLHYVPAVCRSCTRHWNKRQTWFCPPGIYILGGNGQVITVMFGKCHTIRSIGCFGSTWQGQPTNCLEMLRGWDVKIETWRVSGSEPGRVF